MINRESYLSQLIKLRDQDLIKVVTGIRRCGKSTLLMAFRQYLYANGVQNNAVLSLNFEERESARFATWEEVYDYIIAHLPNIPKRYVFLDEVQILPHFEHDSGRMFRQYMNTSCFPEAVNLSRTAPEMVNAYLQSVYDTVVIKDIVQRNKLRKFDTLQRVINFLYDSIGSVVSPNNIADTLSRTSGQQMSHNTVLKYLRYFTESYLIYPVRLYNIKGKRLLASNYKYYVVDLGFRNLLQTNAPTIDLGHKLENVVYFELLRRGGEVYAGRTDAGEVDFVVIKHNGEREYYQVAYTVNDEKTLNRELSSLRKIKDTYPKYLLTTDFDRANIDGIRKINVIDWLLGKE